MINIIIQWAVPVLIYSVIAWLCYRLGYKNGYQVAEMTINDRAIEIDGNVAYIGIINAEIERVLIASDNAVTIYKKAGEI